MRPKILFAIYSIRIRSRKLKDFVDLSDGGIDFFNTFKTYFDGILKLPQVLEIQKDDTGQDIPTKKLTLLNAKRYKVSKKKRYIVGEFYLGTTDTTVDVIDLKSNQPLFTKAQKKSVGYYRGFFFYLTIPKSEKVGYIVIRKVGIHGMKGDFEHGFRSWFNDNYSGQGLSFILRQVTNSILLKQLLKTNPMYEFKIIKHTVPASPEASFKKDAKGKKELMGKFEVAWKSPYDLGKDFKNVISNVMDGTKISKTIELGTDIDQEFDEIEYQLELNGKKKKFSLYKEAKMRSDRDVTNNLHFLGQSTEPTLKSLIKVAKEMVEDFSIKS